MNRENSIFEQIGGTYVQAWRLPASQFRDCSDRGIKIHWKVWFASQKLSERP